MTKQELVNRVAGGALVSPEVTEKVINQTMEEIKVSLAIGKSIYLRGFGTWMPKKRKAKTARNISRGTQILVPAHKVPFFKPSKEFKELVK